MKISVVVPVLNEGKYLRKTLTALNIADNEELIVVDGGSTDRTVSIASEFTDNVFVTHKGRGHQMNYGAERTSGEIILFLHADCILPKEGFTIIRKVLKNKKVSAGAFDLRIDHPSFRFRIIENGANLRARISTIPYGDQGMFMRKAVFDQIGGFAEIPLMEDVEISKRLRKVGKVVFVRPPMKSSPRRLLKEGLLYSTLRDWILAISYTFLKVSPERLIKHYRDIR